MLKQTTKNSPNVGTGNVGANGQIPGVERILAAPALLAEFATSKHQGVKEGQREQGGFVFHRPFVGTDAFFVKEGPTPAEVGFQIGGGFVHDFDAALQQGFRDGFEMRQGRGFRREKATKVRVRTIRGLSKTTSRTTSKTTSKTTSNNIEQHRTTKGES
jgi:hypothetical protein